MLQSKVLSVQGAVKARQEWEPSARSEATERVEEELTSTGPCSFGWSRNSTRSAGGGVVLADRPIKAGNRLVVNQAVAEKQQMSSVGPIRPFSNTYYASLPFEIWLQSLLDLLWHHAVVRRCYASYVVSSLRHALLRGGLPHPPTVQPRFILWLSNPSNERSVRHVSIEGANQTP